MLISGKIMHGGNQPKN